MCIYTLPPAMLLLQHLVITLMEQHTSMYSSFIDYVNSLHAANNK